MNVTNVIEGFAIGVFSVYALVTIVGLIDQRWLERQGLVILTFVVLSKDAKAISRCASQHLQ